MRTKYNEREVESGFADSRLDTRFNIICNQLEQDLSATLPQSSPTKSSTKAMYRFLGNQSITPTNILSAHNSTLLESLNGSMPQRFLQLSDSTELDFTNKKGAEDLGPLTYLKRRGMITHNSLILNDQAVPLGLLDQNFIVRKEEHFGKSASRRNLPIEEKEGYRWLTHFDKGQALCEQNEHLEGLYIADREADLIELYNRRNCERMHFLIRAKHNRRLANQPDKLFDHLGKQPLAGIYKVAVTDSITKKLREAVVEVRYCEVSPKLANQRKNTKHIKPTTMYAIEAKEIGVLSGIANPVHWRLLTTLPVTSLEQALQIVYYYSLRWIIERFHFLLKSGGANVEDLQLKTAQRLQNAVTTYSIAALNVFKIRYLAQYQPDRKIFEVGITPLEYKVLFTYAHKKISPKIQYIPDQQPTVKEFCIVLGQIGGFMPSKRQPIPGLKILSRAIPKLNFMIDTYLAFFQ